MKSATQNDQVSQIPLYGLDGTIKGYGRVWKERNMFCWAHPDGSFGAEDTFEESVNAVECVGFISEAP